MGDLKYSVLIEKLTGHTGIKLLEESRKYSDIYWLGRIIKIE